MKIRKVEKVVGKFHDKKRLCRTHKKFKTRTKSWISIEKECIESLNSIQKLS